MILGRGGGDGHLLDWMFGCINRTPGALRAIRPRRLQGGRAGAGGDHGRAQMVSDCWSGHSRPRHLSQACRARARHRRDQHAVSESLPRSVRAERDNDRIRGDGALDRGGATSPDHCGDPGVSSSTLSEVHRLGRSGTCPFCGGRRSVSFWRLREADATACRAYPEDMLPPDGR